MLSAMEKSPRATNSNSAFSISPGLMNQSFYLTR